VSAEEQRVITGAVTCATHSHAMLATGGDDGVVLLVQPTSAKTIGLLQPGTPCEGVEHMVFNATGSMLAVGASID